MDLEVDRIASQLPGGSADAQHIELARSGPVASSAFDVDGVLASSALHAVSAADGVGEMRGMPVAQRTIDLEHVGAVCTTHCTVDGAPAPVWAELSGVYEGTNGRSIQLHCNFPHHADGVVELLGTTPDRASVAAEIAQRDVFELEQQLNDVGMIGAAIRTLDEWEAHPHAAATRDLPLMSVQQIGKAAPKRDLTLDPHAADSDGSLTGLRVLDCSRVLAGPVAGQMLAGFGADVLRLGAAHLPSVDVGVVSTGFGKRNAFADLRAEPGRESMSSLLQGADIWIDAYRPGALSNFGFTPEQDAEIRPGIVIVQVSAFDWVGPWAGRRGFDSIVQSTTGVRWAGRESAVDASGVAIAGGPLGLPVQALDYATGFLAAGAASQMLQHQRAVGGSWLVRLSLLRTRNWLVSRGGPSPFTPTPLAVDERFLGTVDSDFGKLTTVRPFAGRQGTPPQRLGSARPAWLTRIEST